MIHCKEMYLFFFLAWWHWDRYFTNHGDLNLILIDRWMIIGAAPAPAISFKVIIIGHAFYLPFYSIFLGPKGTFRFNNNERQLVVAPRLFNGTLVPRGKCHITILLTFFHQFGSVLNREMALLGAK